MGQRLLRPGDYQIRVRGRTDERIWNFECDLIEKGPGRVRLRTRTDPPHEIELTPRHVGVRMGDWQAGHGTICYISLDGKAESLAQYCEYPKGILVVPHDYGPLWVYEVPEAEQRELADEIEAIRQELKEPAP